MVARRVEVLTRVLPRGTGTVGAWLLVTGLASYGYLTITGRALGADGSQGLSALWALSFLLGPGACLPVEQEASRAIASRRARGLGGGPVVRRATIATVVLAAVLVVGTLAVGRVLLADLFDDDVLLLVGLLLLLVGYAFEYLVRGVLAGNDRFGPYGWLLGAEAGSRLLAAAVLALLGVTTAGPYGLVLGLAPFVGVAFGLLRPTGLAPPGPPAPWRELTRALGWLLAASLLAQALINLGPVLVKVLAPAKDEQITSAFLASLVVSRVPVFMFQAVQAAFLPKLAGHAGSGEATRLAADTRRLTVAVGILCVVATIGAAVLGPPVVGIAFGEDFALGSRDFALLAAGSSIYLLALTLAQALIALEFQARVALGWLVGVVAFVLGIALVGGIPFRIEVGFLAGTVAATVAMGALLLVPLRRATALEARIGGQVPSGR